MADIVAASPAYGQRRLEPLFHGVKVSVAWTLDEEWDGAEATSNNNYPDFWSLFVELFTVEHSSVSAE